MEPIGGMPECFHEIFDLMLAVLATSFFEELVTVRGSPYAAV